MKTNLSIEEQIALDDLIHDVMTEKASEVNNQGIEYQIEFLKSEGYSEEEIKTRIKERAEY